MGLFPQRYSCDGSHLESGFIKLVPQPELVSSRGHVLWAELLFHCPLRSRFLHFAHNPSCKALWASGEGNLTELPARQTVRLRRHAPPLATLLHRASLTGKRESQEAARTKKMSKFLSYN
ncbi:hypothetical protein SKAU_G00106850 [Synaphobranchus kaupii]|uniref:Uncharacterized protein n=1 Tax=Synaphobranchus kaupii TaxID=118154 RepID=A0A9Q1G0B9_SYNKA|nr:hypothetical protein SKAU_G00106850 [Synaphobranchus kaupii]